jgi:hypothetical protein
MRAVMLVFSLAGFIVPVCEVTAMIQGREVKATVDTGATSTDLYKTFADKFEDLLKGDGKKDSTEVHGVGPR